MRQVTMSVFMSAILCLMACLSLSGPPKACRSLVQGLKFVNPSVPERFICVGAIRPLRRDCTRLRDRRKSLIVSKGPAAVFLSKIAAGTSVKYFKLSQSKSFDTFWHYFQDSMTSQSRVIRRQSRKIVKSEKIMVQTFFKYESTCDSTDVLASMYDRKTAARSFDTIHDILRSLSLAQYFLKGRNANLAHREPRC